MEDLEVDTLINLAKGDGLGHDCPQVADGLINCGEFDVNRHPSKCDSHD